MENVNENENRHGNENEVNIITVFSFMANHKNYHAHHVPDIDI